MAGKTTAGNTKLLWEIGFRATMATIRPHQSLAELPIPSLNTKILQKLS
jgi:hypothetical protein